MTGWSHKCSLIIHELPLHQRKQLMNMAWFQYRVKLKWDPYIQVGPREVGPLQVRAAQVGAGEVTAAQVGHLEIDVAQVQPRQVCPAEIQPLGVHEREREIRQFSLRWLHMTWWKCLYLTAQLWLGRRGEQKPYKLFSGDGRVVLWGMGVLGGCKKKKSENTLREELTRISR